MNDILRAAATGALCGSRSMMGPALAMRSPMARLFAAGEMLADKFAAIPPRTSSLPLAGRIASGAIAAATSAYPGARLRAAVVGAAAAGAASYGLNHLRRLATDRLGVPNAVAGLLEDAAAISLAVFLTRAERRSAS